MAALEPAAPAPAAAAADSDKLAPVQAVLAPFNPSMPDVVTSAVELLALQAGDVLYELGCGDGRVMIAAAQATAGLRCVGVEYDKTFYDRAQKAIDEGGLGEMVEARHGDALEVPLDDATAVFVYLVPKGLKLVAPALKEVLRRPGTRIVSYLFSVPGTPQPYAAFRRASIPPRRETAVRPTPCHATY